MIFCDCVFSLRSWGIISLGVGKTLCFCGDEKAVMVYCGEGPGLAGIEDIFSNGEQGEHGGSAL